MEMETGMDYLAVQLKMAFALFDAIPTTVRICC